MQTEAVRFGSARASRTLVVAALLALALSWTMSGRAEATGLPSVELQYPIQFAGVAGTVELTAKTASLPPRTLLAFTIGGRPIATVAAAPLVKVKWNSTSFPDGETSLVVQATQTGVPLPSLKVTHTIEIDNSMAAAHKARPVVSLTFDDGTAGQAAVGPMLAATGLHATFFVNSGRIGLNSAYMTKSEIRALQNAGNEIGGHSVFHLHLPQLSLAEQQRQICDDRVALLRMGFDVTDFAYPFGENDPSTQQIVHDCGYNSARGSGYTDHDLSEGFPPRDFYRLAGEPPIVNTDNLTTLEGYVKQAEVTGGWAVFEFHLVCPKGSCAPEAIDPALLNSFLIWLAAQQRAGTLDVSTVRGVIGGTEKPSIPAASPIASVPKLVNAGFEADTLQAGDPTCWDLADDGINTASWARVAGGHSGQWAEKVSVSNFVSGRAGLVSTEDLGACAVDVHIGDHYQVSIWYKSTAPIVLVAYYRTASGGYDSLGRSGSLPKSATWVQGRFNTKAVPAGAEAMSIGIDLMGGGTMILDDAAIADVGLLVASERVQYGGTPLAPDNNVQIVGGAGAVVRSLAQVAPLLPHHSNSHRIREIGAGSILLIALALALADRRLRPGPGMPPIERRPDGRAPIVLWRRRRPQP